MAVGIGEQAGQESVAYPFAGAGAQANEGSEPGQNPDVRERRDDGALVDAFADPGDDEELGGVSDGKEMLKGGSLTLTPKRNCEGMVRRLASKVLKPIWRRM